VHSTCEVTYVNKTLKTSNGTKFEVISQENDSDKMCSKEINCQKELK